MENKKKQMGSSSSASFCADLFGTKESTPPASKGNFGSIFPPPSMVQGKKSSFAELAGNTQKQPSANYEWTNKQGAADIMTKERNIFRESVEPCPLSSSLCYGGQEDMYIIDSSSTQTSGSYPFYKKDAVDDDPNENNLSSACRGNWWQGSLYY